MLKTLKINGQTYLLRQELCKIGFTYSFEHGGYIGNFYEGQLNTVIQMIESKGLEHEFIDFVVIDEAFMVKQKNLRAEKIARRYEVRAMKNESKLKAVDLSQGEKDFLVLAEPIKIGHHSEGRHRRLIEKSRRISDKRCELFNKIEESESKAEYWSKKKYLTTQEKEDKKNRIEALTQKAMELWKEDHKIGSFYEGFHNVVPLEIVKINKNTITTKTGSKWNINYSRDFGDYLKKAKNILITNT